MKRISNTDDQPPLTAIFVANDLSSFLLHREYLMRAVLKSGGSCKLYADPGVQTVPPLPFGFTPVRIERFRFSPTKDFWLFIIVLRAILVERPSALNLVTIKPYLLGGLAARIGRMFGWSGKVVFTVPGLGRVFSIAPGEGVGEKLRRRIVERLLQVAAVDAHVIFETDHDRDVWIEKGFSSPERMHVVDGTGIDLAAFSGRGKSQDGPISVLFAGRLLRQKGLAVFLEAARLIKHRGHGGIRMLVAGRHDADPDSVGPEILQDNPDITFLGFVEDMPSVLRTTHVVVLLSKYNEGIPRILLESAASECVSVATSFPGSRRLIEDGRTGLFVEDGTEGEMASELYDVLVALETDRERVRSIGCAARRNVENGGFSISDVEKLFLSILLPAPVEQPSANGAAD